MQGWAFAIPQDESAHAAASPIRVVLATAWKACRPIFLSRVLQREPDWSLLPGTVSPVLTVILRQCLVKDPRERMHDVTDVRLAMSGAFDTMPGAARAVAPDARECPRGKSGTSRTGSRTLSTSCGRWPPPTPSSASCKPFRASAY